MKHARFLLPALLVAGLGHASCGSSYCMVNTNWDTQGLSNESGWLADLRYSYARADQWQAGAKKIATEAPSHSGEEIENRRTINQMANLNLDYAINRQWGVMLGLPYVMRDHAHTLDPVSAGPVGQQAKFSEIGDIRVVGKYKFGLSTPDAGAGLRFGVKLPTGATNKAMTPSSPDDPAASYKLERSSQPGSGSTDGILGAYYFRNRPGNDLGWFVNAQFQSAVAIKDGYRPGNEISLDVGMHYEVLEGLNLLMQANAMRHSRDSGVNANPASGGHSISLSPGLNYAVTTQTALYAYLQRPIVQYLKTDPAEPASGQLAARWSAVLGMNHRF